MNHTIRLESKTHGALKELSKWTGRTMTSLLTEAVDQMRRRLILEASAKGYQLENSIEAAERDGGGMGDVS